MEGLAIPKDTSVTRSYTKAQGSINRALQIAIDKMGRVPFGHYVVDPRTVAARNALLNGVMPTLPFNSDYIKPKPADIGKHPMPKYTPQSVKTAAAGYVVDPTAIESAQQADTVDVDTASGAGLANDPGFEGP